MSFKQVKDIQDKRKSYDKATSKKPVKNDMIIINPDRDTRLDMKMAQTQEGYFVARNEKASIFDYKKGEIPEPPQFKEVIDPKVQQEQLERLREEIKNSEIKKRSSIGDYS